MDHPSHIDIAAADLDWRDGEPGVRYARFLLDPANPSGPSVILSRFEPNATVAPHTHESHYFEYILAGEQTVGRKRFTEGDIRMVRAGTGYGPIAVGPQGCTVLIVFENGARSMMQRLPRPRPALAG